MSLSSTIRFAGYVAIGSGAGGALRYLLSIYVRNRVPGPFPVGTLLINISGSLLLGFLVRYYTETSALSPELRALLTAGFCGGFTTFSAFSLETAELIQISAYGQAAAYVAASIGVSLAGTFAGFALAQWVAGRA